MGFGKVRESATTPKAGGILTIIFHSMRFSPVIRLGGVPADLSGAHGDLGAIRLEPVPALSHGRFTCLLEQGHSHLDVRLRLCQ